MSLGLAISDKKLTAADYKRILLSGELDEEGLQGLCAALICELKNAVNHAGEDYLPVYTQRDLSEILSS